MKHTIPAQCEIDSSFFLLLPKNIDKPDVNWLLVLCATGSIPKSFTSLDWKSRWKWITCTIVQRVSLHTNTISLKCHKNKLRIFFFQIFFYIIGLCKNSISLWKKLLVPENFRISAGWYYFFSPHIINNFFFIGSAYRKKKKFLKKNSERLLEGLFYPFLGLKKKNVAPT